MDAEDVNVLDFKSSVLHFLIICDQKEVAQSVDPWEDPTVHRSSTRYVKGRRISPISIRNPPPPFSPTRHQSHSG